MGLSAFQAAVRILLEIALLASFGYWGWHLSDDRLVQIALALLLAGTGAAVWAFFGTPGDPGRGKSPIVVPGKVRLLIELALFMLAAYGLWTSGSRVAAETLLTAYGLHLAVTYDRVIWLYRH